MMGMSTASCIMLDVMAAPLFPMRVRLRYIPAEYVNPVIAPRVRVNVETCVDPALRIRVPIIAAAVM